MNDDSAMPRRQYIFKIFGDIGNGQKVVVIFRTESEQEYTVAKKEYENALREKKDIRWSAGSIMNHLPYDAIKQMWIERIDKTEIYNKEYNTNDL